DHVVQGHRVLPGAAQLEMLRFAARQAFDGEAGLQWKNVAWLRPIRVDAEGIDLQLTLAPREDGDLDAEIHSRREDGATLVCSRALIAVEEAAATAPSMHDLAALQRQCTVAHIQADACYARLAALGLHYGPAFRGLGDVYVGQGKLLARIALPASARTAPGDYVLHPSVVDAALQSTLMLHPQTSTLMLPSALGSLQVLAPCTASMWALVQAGENASMEGVVQ